RRLLDLIRVVSVDHLDVTVRENLGHDADVLGIARRLPPDDRVAGCDVRGVARLEGAVLLAVAEERARVCGETAGVHARLLPDVLGKAGAPGLARAAEGVANGFAVRPRPVRAEPLLGLSHDPGRIVLARGERRRRLGRRRLERSPAGTILPRADRERGAK